MMEIIERLLDHPIASKAEQLLLLLELYRDGEGYNEPLIIGKEYLMNKYKNINPVDAMFELQEYKLLKNVVIKNDIIEFELINNPLIKHD